jgi:hypothetical protein
MVHNTPPYGHAPAYQINTIKKQLFDLGVKGERYHKGHYSMRNTALSSCIHIPNIIDLSPKMLWPRQENTILKKQLFYLEVKSQGPTKVMTVCDTPTK